MEVSEMILDVSFLTPFEENLHYIDLIEHLWFRYLIVIVF